MLSFLITGCGFIKESPKYGFKEGYYHSKLYHKKVKTIYVVPGDDSIKIYSAKRLGEGLDTTQSLKLGFPLTAKPLSFETYILKKESLTLMC